jgi:hypothetical protein
MLFDERPQPPTATGALETIAKQQQSPHKKTEPLEYGQPWISKSS